MGFIDKAKHKLDEALGNVKEGTGRAVGNERMEHEGRSEQGGARAKQAGEHLKDAVADVKRMFKKN